jgi:hypothetical protein
VVAALQERGFSVELVEGAKGEFTVLVDGRVVARKAPTLPSVEEVVAAVRRAKPAGAGAG